MSIRKSRMKVLMFNAFKAGWELSGEGYNAEYTHRDVDVDKDLEAEFDALWIAMQHSPEFDREYPCNFEASHD